MPTVSGLVIALESIAPLRYAEPWDNVGLLVGDPAAGATRAMLTIDYTPAVAAEAAAAGCDAVVAYHPPIFKPPLSRVTASDPASSLIFDAARRGMAIYSPHTALDVAAGGTNDVLADAIGMAAEGRRPLRAATGKATACKLVTFAPADAVEPVSDALFAAGAGRIGKYESCSFRADGTGTFFGTEGTNPAVGQAGRLERVAEVRIETIVPLGAVDAVVRALRATHPYEEPAFDLNTLAAPPEAVGLGRVGPLAEPASLSVVLDRIKRGLALDHLLVAGPTDRTIARVACCAGACGGDLLDAAIAAKVDLYLTGEMRHHDAVKAERAGLTVVCTLHSNSERATLKRLKAMLGERLPSLEVLLSGQDRDPFRIR